MDVSKPIRILSHEFIKELNYRAGAGLETPRRCQFYDVASVGDDSKTDKRRYTGAQTREIRHSKEGVVLLQGNKTSATTLLPKLATTDADIGCFQELSHEDSKFQALKRKLKTGKYIHDDEDVRQQWRAEGTPSIKSPNGGTPAGTMICTHPNVDVSPIPVIDGDGRDKNSPYEVANGHASALVFNGWSVSRLVVASVYMDGNAIKKRKDRTVDIGVKNRAILFVVGAIIAQMSMPYVLMGDWNMEPDQLAQTGFLDQVGGYVVSPNEPTCWCGDNEKGSTIDYAVVGNSIVGYVQAVEFDRRPRINHIVMLG